MDNINLNWPRRSGILMHISSLPGPYGIGDLGPEAYRFVDWLVGTKQTIWGVLPLNPTGYGDSPYAGLSVFAGNPLFISLDKLLQSGWLVSEDFQGQPDYFSETEVDYGFVIEFHATLLNKAYSRFTQLNHISEKETFLDWCNTERYWLDDYALFMALKVTNGGGVFCNWDKKVVRRNPAVLAKFKKKLHDLIEFQKFQQWLFFTQWKSLKEYANSKGIEIMGEVPIYTGYDCCDVWANQNLFFLDEQANPTVVAGAPPDFFSSTGQLWGNPIYNWNVHKKSGFSWWVERMKKAFELFDISVIDHFRGFAGYYEIPAGDTTAEKGRWVKGPGQDFFDVVFKALPNIKLVVEDLGIITPDVIDLLDENNFLGMSILQFAWGGSDDDSSLPHNHSLHKVVYTSTHNNDTTIGWWNTAPQNERDFFVRYSSCLVELEPVNWAIIRAAMISVSHTCIISMQDVFGLGSESRMNFPGRLGRSWTWRLPKSFLDDPVKEKLRQYTLMFNRYPEMMPESEW